MFSKSLFLIGVASNAFANPVTPVVVTAKRPDSFPLPPSAKKTVYTSEKLKKNQYAQVTEVINATPGYTVVQSGSIGQQSSVFVRGTNSGHFQVRLDGVRINSPESENGSFDAALLTSHNLSTITLVRGGQSSLYGADAIGGVMLLATPEGTGPFQEAIRLEAGSQKTVNAYGHLTGSSANTGLYIGVSRFATGGISQTPMEYRQVNGRYPRLPYRQGSYAIRLDHNFNEYTSLKLVSRLASGHLSYQLRDRAVPQHRQQNLQRIAVTVKPVPYWQHHFGFGYLSTHQVNARHDPAFTKNTGHRQQLDWTQNLEHETLGSTSVTAEASKDSASHIEYLTTNSSSQQSRSIGTLWHKKWQWISLDLSARHDKISQFHHSNTHREGLVITPFKTTRILAGHSTSFKAPTLYQLYARSPYFVGNPYLKPEQARQWEAGFEQRIFGQFLWEETYFINHLTNLINSTPDWRSITNIGRARTSGLESVLIWAGHEKWSGDINHTYTKTRNLTTGLPLLRRPKNKVSARLHYNYEDWLWTTEITWIGKRQDIDPLTFRVIQAKPYGLINLKAQKKLSESLNTFGRIENLLNKKIQNPIGYRQAGISIFLGIEATIG